ncbi:unnamed protein product [Bathycoccus prasinos]
MTTTMLTSRLASHSVSSSSSSRVAAVADRRAAQPTRYDSSWKQQQQRHPFPLRPSRKAKLLLSGSDSSKIEVRIQRRRAFVRSTTNDGSNNHQHLEEKEEREEDFEKKTREEGKDWERKLFNVDDGNEGITIGKIWAVPWSLSHVVVVMMLWMISFLWVGQSFVPWATFHMGFDAEALTSRGVALYSLFADIAACVVGIFCVWFGTRKYQEELTNTNWFRVTFESVEEFKRCSKETLLFVATFPLVNLVAELNSKLCDYFANGGTIFSLRGILTSLFGGNGSSTQLTTTPVVVNPSNFERVAMSGDGVSVLFYAVLVAVVAPIWEEVIFRGFLMPSLTKKWRVSTSICLSSCIFALAHFSMDRFLPLTALSVALSILYVRTRNVVAPIVLHALWNAAAVLEATDAFDVLLEGLLEALGVLVGA